MESLFPAPFWEVLYGSHLQGNLSLLSPNHSGLPPHLLLNASHSAFLPLGLKVTIVGLYLAVCIGGLLGNCLVMYVILRYAVPHKGPCLVSSVQLGREKLWQEAVVVGFEQVEISCFTSLTSFLP